MVFYMNLSIINATTISAGTSAINVNAIVWLILLALLLVLEGMTYALICIWFAGGAIAAIITSFFTQSVLIQATAFVIVSAILLMLVRPVAVRLTATSKVKTNADRVIGQEGIVLRTIDPISGEGQVKVIGQIWSAKPEDGVSVIKIDSHVEIVGIAGVKVIVRAKGLQY